MTRALKKVERAEIEVDAQTMERVVESVVVRGDISALAPADKARLYIQTCESLGLNPATQPLAPLRLNGKEILYPTRGATDQLAAIHKLNREIVDGPKIVDINGTKVGYCVAKATHPNGRTETAIATVPATDPAMLYMKLETKAKRRVTLSILGLGWLDETEIESIPAAAKAAVPTADMRELHHAIATMAREDGAARYVVPPVELDPSGAGESPELGALAPLDALRDELVRVESRDDLRRVWHAHRAAVAGLCEPGDEGPLKAARELCWQCASGVLGVRTKKDLAAILAGQPDPPPTGTDAPRGAANDATDATGGGAAAADAGGAASARSLDAYRAYLSTKATVSEVERAFAAHVADYDADEAAQMRVAVARLRALAPDMSEGICVNRLRLALNDRARKRGAAKAAAALAIAANARRVA